ncbi:MAG: hypothetical protein E6R03_16720 [Hyphomicrobiaceae bacterium]|nr:MAG: hypothetical protein E6R03_16720 [Hyphomicrobiaceae bacterium]
MTEQLMAGSFDGPVPGKRCAYCRRLLPMRLFTTKQRKEHNRCIKCRNGFTTKAQYPFDELQLGNAADD